jgi:hypothetical protein
LDSLSDVSVDSRFLKAAGGPAFETSLIFRVAHLSRRATGGAFDFDSLIEKSMLALHFQLL